MISIDFNRCVFSFAQAGAGAGAAQAGASVIQIFVGHLRDWARNHSDDPEIEAALKRGEDPGLAFVSLQTFPLEFVIQESCVCGMICLVNNTPYP
ncbi:hypothetical protein LWI28_007587 [Acer negundo]|uniref:Uncharacterized protein n=1 Tax=Acer negundo TaxID=4023 RepID=A0AAD5J4A6_ACENE|nr:hypothetical protein LWI28_007587 [Acer negundo]